MACSDVDDIINNNDNLTLYYFIKTIRSRINMYRELAFYYNYTPPRLMTELSNFLQLDKEKISITVVNGVKYCLECSTSDNLAVFCYRMIEYAENYIHNITKNIKNKASILPDLETLKINPEHQHKITMILDGAIIDIAEIIKPEEEVNLPIIVRYIILGVKARLLRI
jgi:hypothetical protein